MTVNNKFKGGNIYFDNYAETFSQVNASGLSKTQPVEIIGNDSANYIKGGKSSDTISGDSGNDILSGDKGNNILTGGGGNDIFVHEGGNDYIADYKPSVDKIFIKSGVITDSFLSGSKNIILITSGGSVAVKKSKNKKNTVIDSSGKETSNI